MEAELKKYLIAYLGDEYSAESEKQLELCILRAISSFKTYVDYPSGYETEKIEADIKRNQFCIFDLALYFYNMQGMEFVKSFSESGTSRAWSNENEIFAKHGVVPFVRI